MGGAERRNLLLEAFEHHALKAAGAVQERSIDLYFVEPYLGSDGANILYILVLCY